MGVSEVELKTKTLRHFKVYPVQKINEIFHRNLDLCVVPMSSNHIIFKTFSLMNSED